jgi:hypothetical protein
MPLIRSFSAGSSYFLHVCPDDVCEHNCPAHVDEKGRPVEEHFIREWTRVGGDTMALGEMKTDIKALYKAHIARQAAVTAPSELAKTTFS